MTSTASPISSATEHKHHQNDDQDQFHGISPLRRVGLVFVMHLSNVVFKVLFRNRTRFASRGVSNFAQSSFAAEGQSKTLVRGGLSSDYAPQL